jgi:hypothetical protein
VSFNPIREHDGGGQLVAAGCEWAEATDSPGIPLYLLAGAGVVAALIGVWVALVGDSGIGAPIVVGGLAVAWWARRALKRNGENRRALIFRVDGSVATLTAMLPVEVPDILNIEYRLDFDTPYIVLATRDGRKIDVIGNKGIEDDEGRRIHMQLGQALHEIRQARL